MPNRNLTIVLSGTLFAALYVVLYHLSDLISGNLAFGGIASLFFLPAFVRLLAFLIIGYWSIPFLFVAAMLCVDLGLTLEGKIVLSTFLAIGAPLGIAAASRALDLDHSLANLTSRKLLLLSAGSAFGNAIAYNTALALLGLKAQTFLSHAITFIGDVAGTWALIYLVKASLTLTARTRCR